MRAVPHRSRPVFVEPARSLPAMSLLEHTALLRQHLGQTIAHTNKEVRSVQREQTAEVVHFGITAPKLRRLRS